MEERKKRDFYFVFLIHTWRFPYSCVLHWSGTPSYNPPSGEPTHMGKLPYNIRVSSISFIPSPESPGEYSICQNVEILKECSFQKNQILLRENRESCKIFWNYIFYLFIYLFISLEFSIK